MMFEAILLVCAVAGPTPDKCVEAGDTWGPYKGKARCEIRLKQMVEEVLPVMTAVYFPNQQSRWYAVCKALPERDA